MNGKICLIYNYAHHYRTDIFCLLDKEFSIDFVFGDKYLDVKKMDYSLLDNFKKEVKNKVLFKKPIYYQTGVLRLFFEKQYSSYLMLGETICVSTWLMLFLCKIFNKKIYFWSHGWYGKESFFRRSIKKIFFSLPDGTFLYNNHSRNLMIKHNFNKNKLHVIYNSLSYDTQLKERSKIKESKIFKNKFNNTNKNLIFIGRLTKVKKLHLLIEALNILKNRSKHYNLIFIGQGESKQELINLVKKLNLSDVVWFYGASYNEAELSNLIYNADLCVSPGNVGLTAIHSLTYGTPVITHNNFNYQMPEFESIEVNKTGLFFNFDDITSLSNNIELWFDQNLNRNQIREACYKVIDTKFNPYYQIEIFKKFLK
jgi:glycosyltransferase involved in cell wall biosynthesis